MQFEVLSNQGFARRARLRCLHGTIDTPVFMPVGTLGAVKTLGSDDLKGAGSSIILGNAYHLNLRPGLDILREAGGLHRFMAWDRPILTDSGGFQVFSLGRLKEVTDDGVHFQSHLNGDRLFVTPELSAEIQQIIGSDISMVLDECVSLPSSEESVRRAVFRSYAWARRFLNVPRLPHQSVFGVVQGGTHEGLRQESLSLTLKLETDGIAIGGLSVGEPFQDRMRILGSLKTLFPIDRPRYLMGVGTPRDILESVRLGIDMFDCVLPTRNARNGGFFTDQGLLNIRNKQFCKDKNPIEEGCPCPCCLRHSRSYLRHLFNVKEILGLRLATLHNLYYYHRLMSSIREALEANRFDAFYEDRIKQLKDAYPGREET